MRLPFASPRPRRWVTLAALLAGLTGAAAASPDTVEPPPAPTPSTPAFTVATYNVLYRNRDLARLARTLKETGADLVALQETNPESESYLRRTLADTYPHMLFRPLTTRSGGFGFLSKQPLRHREYLEPLPGWRGIWIVETTQGGTNLQVANLHLATPQVGAGQSLPAVTAAFQTTETLHAREIQRLLPALTNTLPAILLGDFNSFSFFHAPLTLAQHGWVDSFAAVNPDADRHGTWEFHRGETVWRFRIDFIFHTPDLRTLESRILPSPASDHFPVVSRLRVKEPKGDSLDSPAGAPLHSSP